MTLAILVLLLFAQSIQGARILSVRSILGPPSTPCWDPSSSEFRMPQVPVEDDQFVEQSSEFMLNALKVGLMEGAKEVASHVAGPLSFIVHGIAGGVEGYYEAKGEALSLARQQGNLRDTLQKRFEDIIPSLGRMVKAERLQAAATLVVQDHKQLLRAVAGIMRDRVWGEDQSKTYTRLVTMHDSIMEKRAHWIEDSGDGERAFALLVPAVEMVGVHMAVVMAIVEMAAEADRGRWLVSSYDWAAEYARLLQAMAVTAVEWRIDQYVPTDGLMFEELCKSNTTNSSDGSLLVRQVKSCFLRDNYKCTEEDGLAFGERAAPCSKYWPNAWFHNVTLATPGSCGDDDPARLLLPASPWIGLPESDIIHRQEQYGFDRPARDPSEKFEVTNYYSREFWHPPDATARGLITLRRAGKKSIETHLWKEIFRTTGSWWLALVTAVGCDMQLPRPEVQWMLFKAPQILECLRNRFTHSRLHIVSFVIRAVRGPAQIQAQLIGKQRMETGLSLLADLTGVVVFPLTEGTLPDELNIVVLSGVVSVVQMQVDDASVTHLASSELGVGKHTAGLAPPNNDSRNLLTNSWVQRKLWTNQLKIELATLGANESTPH